MLVRTDLINHNNDDPAAMGAKAEREELMRLQETIMSDPEKSTIITIDDPDNAKQSTRRLIKVNGQRSFVRGNARISASDLEWADPTFLSRKSRSYFIPESIIKHGFDVTERGGGTDPELGQMRQVRSVDKCLCLSKLAFFGDFAGIALNY